MIREYIDVNGQQRRIKFVKKLDGFVRWMKGLYYSKVEQWQLEDGSIVQIPKDAWPVLGIEYKDSYDN